MASQFLENESGLKLAKRLLSHFIDMAALQPLLHRDPWLGPNFSFGHSAQKPPE